MKSIGFEEQAEVLQLMPGVSVDWCDVKLMGGSKMVFKMVDLFAGAGGFSTGFKRVCDGIGVKLELTAINHWDTAVETHALNHPDARHFCESVFEVNPRDVASDGYLDCLTASPECIFHSNARGGGECDEQSRSGANDLLRWLTEIDVQTFVLENVREWLDWCPTYKRATTYKGKQYAKGTPIPHRKGESFRAFCGGLRALGYSIDYAVLNSADYGAYTARNRLFLIAYKGDSRVLFPKISHAANPTESHLKRWHAARDIIDWHLAGESVFLRQAGLLAGKKPLVENTIRRIAWGLENISGIDPAPFMDLLNGTGGMDSVPMIGNTNPFFAKYHGGASGHTRCYGVDRPLLTLDTSNRFSLIEPCLINNRGQSKALRVDQPLPTVTAGPGTLNICEPYLVEMRGTGRARSVNRPLPTVTTSGTHLNVCEPFLIKYFGSGANAVSLDLPLPTVTTKDRFGLITPMKFDLRYRLLEPHELAAGMGFDDYLFAGTKTDVKKQIGNAVEVNQSTALAYSVLEAWLEVA